MARLLRKKHVTDSNCIQSPEDKKRILVVDDSEMIRNFHCYILKNAGFDVLSAIDGADGLEKMLMNKVDLVVTDINMPNMDGLTFIKHIRANENFRDIPVIIISTEDEAEDKQKGFDAGANIYIVKPVDPAQFTESVSMLV
jgi:two-component system chemotaxis response regulator CheY